MYVYNRLRKNPLQLALEPGVVSVPLNHSNQQQLVGIAFHQDIRDYGIDCKDMVMVQARIAVPIKSRHYHQPVKVSQIPISILIPIFSMTTTICRYMMTYPPMPKAPWIPVCCKQRPKSQHGIAKISKNLLSPQHAMYMKRLQQLKQMSRTLTMRLKKTSNVF